MSSGSPATRVHILEAARRLFETQSDRPVRVSDIARVADVSRQAVYLHFGSRAGLLLALVRYVDDVHNFAAIVAAVRHAPSARAAISRFIALWAAYVPHVANVASAMQAMCERDDDAAAAWTDRMNGFAEVCTSLVSRLQRDGGLAPGLDAARAADLLWSMLSIQSWRGLVDQRRWSQCEYVDHMTHAVLRVVAVEGEVA